MFSVHINTKARFNIKRFINSYRHIFLDLYSDTGIYHEDKIRKQYQEISKNLFEKIYITINDTLKNQLVL